MGAKLDAPYGLEFGQANVSPDFLTGRDIIKFLSYVIRAWPDDELDLPVEHLEAQLTPGPADPKGTTHWSIYLMARSS